MPVFTDQTGRNITINNIPRRIISLVPSQTELLADLGLEQEVVGITKFCVHPESWFREKARVGGTKQVKTDVIHALHPDLIIANKEENVKEQIEELATHYPVWISDVHDLDSAFEMMDQLGRLTDRHDRAIQLVNEIKRSFSNPILRTTRLKTCYLIWKDPYMTVGGDTFIHCMMEEAGFENIFSGHIRYPKLDLSQLPIADLSRGAKLTRDCRLLLLSSEPYPFRQKHVDELQALLPEIKVMLVDGEMFSWYGSRLLKAASYFRNLRKMIDDKTQENM